MDAYTQGYRDMVNWLRLVDSATARHALAQREATGQDLAYNNGGNQALRDFIARGEGA